MANAVVDLAIIGGGVNGCGIARDAVGRGLSVYLCEMNDLAEGTSSASTKLFHGGLRYLEYYAFRLVREALIEREILLRSMPHISWPLRFVLPHHRGLRSRWLLRLGLFIYDHLGGRKILPPTQTLDLEHSVVGAPLKSGFRVGYEYSDCWVEDSRLVMLNARDAANRGAQIAVGAKCVSATRIDALWHVTIVDQESGLSKIIKARALVNAGGAWVSEIIQNNLQVHSSDQIRLVRGSHIVVQKLYDHDRAYIFQNADGRIIFLIPYEQDFTLIGTTDRDHKGSPSKVVCTDEEIDYLCASASVYLDKPVSKEQVVWTYSGVRPLYDDGVKSATAATRDYVLKVDVGPGETAPLVNIFGGKITTYRRLAEATLDKLRPWFDTMGKGWTAAAALPGGDFPVDGFEPLVSALCEAFPFISESWMRRLVRAYGTETRNLLGGAQRLADLGLDFGGTLTEAEVRWLMGREWARTAHDVVWRRSRLGLRMSEDQIAALDQWMLQTRSSETAKITADG